jgi:hypothetical protein
MKTSDFVHSNRVNSFFLSARLVLPRKRIKMKIRLPLLSLLLITCFVGTNSQNRRPGVYRRPVSGSTSRPESSSSPSTTLPSSTSTQPVTSTLAANAASSTVSILDDQNGKLGDCLNGAANECFSQVSALFSRVVHSDTQNKSIEPVITTVCRYFRYIRPVPDFR